MQGRRVEDGTSPADYVAGDYGRRGSVWCVCMPDGRFARLDERWTVEEHDDRAITVSPSIDLSADDGWHGHLNHGVWVA